MYYDDAEKSMKDALRNLSNNLVQVRTGRANTSVLDDVRVDYYGQLTPLNQVGSLSVVEGSQIVVKPFDPNSLKDIEKAIHQADLGLNPINDGSVVRVNIPTLTEEVRKEVVKDVSKMGEEAKIVIRNIRRDANSGINAEESYTEDVEHSELKRVQDLTDQHTDKIDQLIEKKSAEVMKI